VDPISRRYLDQLVDAESAYQDSDDDRARLEALHRQVLALASLVSHQAEQIADLGRHDATEEAALVEMAAVVTEGADEIP
jgi:hypothetical protein